MSEFLYLFRGGDAREAGGSPERMQEHMGKWMKWMEDLGKKGKLSGGLPLKNEGKIVKNREEEKYSFCVLKSLFLGNTKIASARENETILNKKVE